MNKSIRARHPKNNADINDNEMNTMNNSVAMLMIYHGIADTADKPTCLKNTSSAFTLVYPE